MTWPSNLSFPSLLDAYVPEAASDRFAINIGARDGRWIDPVYTLYQDRGYGGLAIEGNLVYEPALRHNLGNTSGSIEILME